MSLISKRFLILVAGLGAALAARADLSNTGVLLDSVAAVVNDGIVLRGELEQQVRTISDRILQQGQQLPPQNVLRQQVLERLVLQELQMQRANRAGIKVSDERRDAEARRFVRVLCPSHHDRYPSLKITDDGDRVLLRCFAGCHWTKVLNALNLPTTALFDIGWNPERRKVVRREVAAYDYYDADGTLLAVYDAHPDGAAPAVVLAGA
jgi:hypothetical protein